jgi:type IV pilus assembly protein PilB
MAVSPTTQIPLGGLARKLVAENLLAADVAREAFQTALAEKKPLVTHLVESGLVGARDVALAMAQEFGVPVVDIDSVEIDPETVKLIPDLNILKNHRALPIYKRGSRLFVAVSDPTNLKALDEIKFAVKSVNHVEPIVVEDDKLGKTIDKIVTELQAKLDDLSPGDDGGLDDIDLDADAPPEPGKAQEDDTIDDAPVVKFVNKVLLDAIKRGASDLHFEPYEKFYRIRFRVDGQLMEITRPPIQIAAKLAARVKVMSRLDVSERRVPQDGRIKLKLSKSKSIDFRVNVCPTLFGEKVVMRILNSDAAALQIDMLGYEDEQKALFMKNLLKPYGMFLVTGPTGSGKTVSLYTGINILNQVNVNISTAEDPVEINLPGVNQVQVDERTGMTFEKALKAFLRQDPNIILVGEIRDLVTASIAVKAAATGHMVMSTLHTNDAPQTLTRLQDMGVAAFAVATSINLITAQRLARRLFAGTKILLDLPPEALRKAGFTEAQIASGLKIFGPDKENPDCPGGYKGRCGLYQVMPISDEMRRLIIGGSNSVQLADQARKEGIPDLRMSALRKVASGVTSLEEINEVTIADD